MSEIELGPMLGSSYIVADGLTEGEEIVTQGTFSVDAAAQLEGKPSMMNPSGSRIPSMPGMEMPADTASKDNQSMPGMNNPGDPKQKNLQDNSMNHNQVNSEPSGQESKPRIQREIITVNGLCDMCKERIEKAAKSVKGVLSAVWDSKTKKLDIEYNTLEASLTDIQKNIAAAGHDTGEFIADDKTYESLPECCHYRK